MCSNSIHLTSRDRDYTCLVQMSFSGPKKVVENYFICWLIVDNTDCSIEKISQTHSKDQVAIAYGAGAIVRNAC